MENPRSPGLLRAMGRWTLTALVINSIIGSGIFGLPAVVAGYLGRLSPLAYLIGALAIAVVMACSWPKWPRSSANRAGRICTLARHSDNLPESKQAGFPGCHAVPHSRRPYNLS